MNYNYIVIEGNIGAGKTSFAKKLAADFEARLILERFADNPFLPKFYENPDQYAFPLELSFLAERFQQMKGELLEQELFSKFTISDYLFQKCQIFASINLKADENTLYGNFFSIMNSFLPKPDLVIYLHQDIPRLCENIKQRGREYEQQISAEYLTKVEQGYLSSLKQLTSIKTIIVDVTQLDFVNNQSHYDSILKTLKIHDSQSISPTHLSKTKILEFK